MTWCWNFKDKFKLNFHNIHCPLGWIHFWPLHVLQILGLRHSPVARYLFGGGGSKAWPQQSHVPGESLHLNHEGGKVKIESGEIVWNLFEDSVKLSIWANLEGSGGWQYLRLQGKFWCGPEILLGEDETASTQEIQRCLQICRETCKENAWSQNDVIIFNIWWWRIVSSLKRTVCIWKWMGGRRSFHFGARPMFKGYVSFRAGKPTTTFWMKIRFHDSINKF